MSGGDSSRAPSFRVSPKPSRAIGHIGLANYTGLTVGPLLATALPRGLDAPLAVAVAAPLLACGLTLVPPAPSGSPEGARAPLLARSALWPGAGLALVNVGYAAVVRSPALRWTSAASPPAPCCRSTRARSSACGRSAARFPTGSARAAH
jgi:hypothetical protein